MQRSLVGTLIVGAVVSAIVIALYATGATLPLEQTVISAFSGGQTPARVVGGKLQYPLILLLAFGVAWLVLASSRRQKLAWPLGVVAVELLAIAWICRLYDAFFQPLPSLLAAGLAFALAYVFAQFGLRSRSDAMRELFGGRLAENQITDLVSGELVYEPEAKTCEVTALVCDIANKHDLADEGPAALVGEITQKFIQHAAQSLLAAGAYVETVTGEGIVALFGFPKHDEGQAETATRHALALLESFEKLRANGKDEHFTKFQVHVGVSSGMMVVAPWTEGDRRQLLSTGEPVELARRFCIANRFYGTRVLIGPGTFELSRDAITARPIDFLTGVDSRERHEVYEPLLLATEATPEQIARRDSFWQGVVLYREKRWGEAYAQFQKARGPNDHEDAPLQLYLRRIEPLALQLAMADDE
ncbi:MAG: hypothetical protein M3Y80_02070 [Verrucomicrobiota bacterium]|nr:hypothetical protein [Verrucomicrobiota bacterium]